MASSVIFHNIPNCYSCKYPKTLIALRTSQFLSSKSVLKLKNHSPLTINKVKTQAVPLVFAAQSNLFKVLQTVWKVGRDGVEAGTNLVPDSIPRPIARISVTVVGVTLALFVLKSFLSTAFFVLAVMGLSYFTFLALNKDEGPKGGDGTTSTEDSLEEARRIMEKYK